MTRKRRIVKTGLAISVACGFALSLGALPARADNSEACLSVIDLIQFSGETLAFLKGGPHTDNMISHLSDAAHATGSEAEDNGWSKATVDTAYSIYHLVGPALDAEYDRAEKLPLTPADGKTIVSAVSRIRGEALTRCPDQDFPELPVWSD